MFKFLLNNKLKKEKQFSSDETFFVRNFQTNDFYQTSENPLNKNILIIKKNDFYEKCFCPVHRKWEKAIVDTKNNSVKTQSCAFTGILAQYVIPDRTIKSHKRNHILSSMYYSLSNKDFSIEEVSNKNLKSYLKEYKESKKKDEELEERHKQYMAIIGSECHNDVLFYRININKEKHILTLSQFSINRLMIDKAFPYSNHDITEIPLLIHSEEYDIKNGKYKSLTKDKLSGFSYEIVDKIFYIDPVFKYCEKHIKNELCRMENRNIYFADYNHEIDSHYYYRTKDLHNKLMALIHFPYEPALYFAIKKIMRDEFDSFLQTNPYRLDTNCYQNYCKSLGFTSYKTLKKLFYINQNNLYYYHKLINSGFSDKNIINRILQNPQIDSLLCDGGNHFSFFTKWAIPLKGEKAAWNLIEKYLAHHSNNNIVSDFLYMFHSYFTYLDYEARSSILKDGITVYNHDLLANIGKKAKNTNIDFQYTKEEKELEDSIEGYSFKLPKDYYELVDVATKLHNCAASYRNRILNKETLVMYAMKNDNYVLCIEVRGKTVHQQRVDRNGTPKEKDDQVMCLWRTKHNLKFFGNSY